MRFEERLRIINELHAEEVAIAEGKGRAYAAGSSDVLANFKDVAAVTGVTKYQAWLTYFYKHVSAIITAVRDNPDAPVDKTEGLRGRIMDARVYLAILEALTQEDADVLGAVEVTAFSDEYRSHLTPDGDVITTPYETVDWGDGGGEEEPRLSRRDLAEQVAGPHAAARVEEVADLNELCCGESDKEGC